MIFKQKTPNQNYVLRYAYKNIEVGIWPTLFGFRIKAGYAKTLTCTIDWCCGDNHQIILTYFQLLLEILEYRVDKNTPVEKIFLGLPSHSEIKPLNMDLNFLKMILAFPKKELPVIKIPTTTELRNTYQTINSIPTNFDRNPKTKTQKS